MSFEETQFQNGAAIDTRTDEQKLKDINYVELFATAQPVNWVEKPEAQWRKFPDQDQNGSGSCVAQTIKKLAGVLLWLKEGVFVRFSATHIYQRRSNKPSSGMMGVEAFDFWKQGITLDDLFKSEQMTDAQMDALKIEKYEEDVGKVFAIGGHVGLNNGDFEMVASTIQATGKAIMVWFFFTGSEWSPLIPVVQDQNLTISTGLRHSVAAVDFFLVNGKKYILIEDSAHFGGITRRLISEEFFKARNWFVRYPMNFQFQDQTQPQPAPVDPKPHYSFKKVLEFIPLNSKGYISNIPKHEAQKADVVALQDILRYEGTFPKNVSSTGYYGATTARAVLAFQRKYSVASAAELNSLQGRRVGEKTLAKLNQLYA